MSILAQSGYARGGKVEAGLDEASIRGVIMSPRDETPSRLESAISNWRESYPDITVLLDPQFYVATLDEPRDGHLGDYPFYPKRTGLGRADFSNTNIRNYVLSCLSYQESLQRDLSYHVSPTIPFSSFHDNWSEVALNMAGESFEHHDRKSSTIPLLLSLVIDEAAFNDLEALEDFLNVLTRFDVEGFYLIISSHNNPLGRTTDFTNMSHILYFCYKLSEVNSYKIVMGFTDWFGLLLSAVGVQYTASGWFQNLRQFTMDRFLPKDGGRPASKRYSSSPLLACPLIVPDIRNIALSDRLEAVLTGSSYDQILRSDLTGGSWTPEISCLSHWYSLNAVTSRVEGQRKLSDRLQAAELVITESLQLHSFLQAHNIELEVKTGPNHIREWQGALAGFRAIAHI